MVGFRSAHRPRPTRHARLKHELSLPRPGGIAITLAGASLVFSGALALDPVAQSPQSSPAAASTAALPTPEAASEPAMRSLPSLSTAVESSSADPSAGAPSVHSGPDSSASSIVPLAAVSTVVGAAADSPLNKLYVAGNLPPNDPSLWDINNPSSPLVLANKRRPLDPENYIPPDLVIPAVRTDSAEAALLRPEAALATERMFAAAAAQGVNITVKSSYRSFTTQVSVYNGYVASKGIAAADSTSARPGYSEHQTGYALDIGDANAGVACDFSSCFAATDAARWVAAHGADYGFVVRYVPGSESVTGYLAEPWHLRYLGISVAQDMSVRGIHSYEVYAGLPAATDYQ